MVKIVLVVLDDFDAKVGVFLVFVFALVLVLKVFDLNGFGELSLTEKPDNLISSCQNFIDNNG